MNLELWRTNIKLPEEEIDHLIEEVKDICIPFRNMYTTYGIEKDKPEDKYSELYKNILIKASNDLGLGHRIDGLIFNYWIQVYGNNARHFQHDHASGVTLFSWVHFIRPTKEKCFCFLDSNNTPYYPQQNVGDFIAFPEWALHCVKPNNSREERAVIAGNMNYRVMHRPDGKKTVSNVITECINNTLIIQQKELGNVGHWENPIKWDESID